MRKDIIFLSIVVILICFFCGCVGQSKTLPPISPSITPNVKSDDEVYIENIENFFIQYDENEQRIFRSQESFPSKTNNSLADMKILSKTIYDRIAPLKVSTKLEPSKNSFLQYLTEMGITADLQMSAPYSDPSQELKTHSCNGYRSLIKTFDSELCSALPEKSNLTPFCTKHNTYYC